jgi:Mrp family chromosome partitioning ATPase
MASFRVEQNAESNIRHVIGVVSGKGGVGKSLVTASLANALAKSGARVGILDADITGPSIPKMYGLTGPAEALSETQILPETASNGVKVMSLNLIMTDPEQAVIWRGPVIAGVVKQFWTDVVWGELDYLLVDMPPGTGDVPLTVFQSLPVDGIFIVTSPQDLVRMIVTKALNMARAMDIPVLGVIENYSYLTCPDCGRKIEVFGKSRIEEIAGETGIELAGQIPIVPEYSGMADAGKFAEVENEYLQAAMDCLRRAAR